MMIKSTARVPFEVIQKAVTGDAEAMNSIVAHYQPLIRKMATKRLFDAYGNAYTGVDEALCRRLEAKLMLATLQFRIRDEH